MSYKKDLKKMQDGWEAAKKSRKDYQNADIDNGRYKVQMVDCFLDESSAGNKMIVIKHCILEGESMNETATSFHGITEKSMPFVQNMIETLGFDIPDEASGLDDLCGEMKKEAKSYIIKLINREDGTNIKILKLLDDDDIPKQTASTSKTKTKTKSVVPDDRKYDKELEDELLELSKKHGMADDLKGNEDLNDLIDNLKEYSHEKGEYEPEEILALMKADIIESDGSHEKKEKKEDPDKELLMNFCQAMDVKIGEDNKGKGGEDVNDSHSKEDMIEAIKECEWGIDELDPEETELLERNDLAKECIKKVKEKKKKKKK